MTAAMNTLPDSPALLTFTEAARLSGQPKAYLKELAESGRLAVRMIPGDGESKLRLTRGALAEAGLFPQPLAVAQPEKNDLADLIALVREQTIRITALEEQRFHLGAQLGVAVERVSSLEDQVHLLTGTVKSEHPTLPILPAEVPINTPSAKHALVEFGQVGIRKTGEIREKLFRGRLRFPSRSRNGHESISEGVQD